VCIVALGRGGVNNPLKDRSSRVRKIFTKSVTLESRIHVKICASLIRVLLHEQPHFP
jgi:hypothetical protein